MPVKNIRSVWYNFYLSTEAVLLQELLVVTLQFHMAISVLHKHQVCTMQLQLSLKCQYKREQVCTVQYYCQYRFYWYKWSRSVQYKFYWYKWSRSVQYNIIASISSTGTRTHICYNYIDHLRLCKSKNNRLIKVTLISVRINASSGLHLFQ